MTLSVRNLAISRGGVPLLSEVSFDVPAGSALIVTGPNGVGKTSLLRTIAGLQDADQGVVSCDESELIYASHKDGNKAQLTVEENLRFWADIYGRKVPSSVYKDFDLVDLMDRVAGTLSAGQKRRLGLARLGVVRGAVFLLDEPTVSLDAASVKRFAQFLTEQHLCKGGSALIATHVDLGIEASTLDLQQFAALPSADDLGEAYF